MLEDFACFQLEREYLLSFFRMKMLNLNSTFKLHTTGMI